MQLHRNKAAAYIQQHNFKPFLKPVDGNDYPAIAFTIPYAFAEGGEEIVIRPDQDGLYSGQAIREALGY